MCYNFIIKVTFFDETQFNAITLALISYFRSYKHGLVMGNVIVNGHSFKIKITAAEIDQAVNDIAVRINKDLKDKNPLFVGILNGAFMFASDLMKKVTIDSDITFIKLKSYAGTASTRNITELIGLKEDIAGRSVVIVEDIVDTGDTIEHAVNCMQALGAGDIKVATLLFKPEAYTKTIPLDYNAIVVPNDFVVGYGLDYNGAGRNLTDIYVLDYKADDELKKNN